MEPRPTLDSDVDDPYIQKYTKECKQHKKKHGKYQCSKCNDDFHTLANYHDHIAKHEQIKYQCNICGKSSDSKRPLVVHIKCHTDRFLCQICGKIMTSKSSLCNHQRLHSGQEDICSVCNKAFKSRKSYLDHVAYGHSDRPLVRCYYCGEYFWNPSQRDNHIQAKHKPMRTPTSTVSTASAEEAEPNQEEATPASMQQDTVTETYEATPASMQ